MLNNYFYSKFYRMKIIIEYFLLAMFFTLTILHLTNLTPEVIIKFPKNKNNLTEQIFSSNDGTCNDICSVNIINDNSNI